MFKSLKRVVYHANDLEKAKQWYNGILNTQPVFDSPFTLIYNVGDCSLSLAKDPNPISENKDRPEIYWEVDDIESVYKKLIDSGAQTHTPLKSIMNIRIAKVIDPFGNIIGLTGQAASAKDSKIEDKPSESAMTVAFCRALAFRDDKEGIKGPDYLAEIFLTDDAKKLLADDKSRKWTIQSLVTSPLYGYFISRTAFIDSIFVNALNEEIPQIVFLGAGYDTRPYRFIDIIKSTKIFELDITPTQHKKIEALKKSNVKIPASLVYMPVNFKTEKLEDVITKAGFDKNKKTLFIWEGVMYYLTPEAVASTFKFIKQNSPEGSTVCFDFLNEKMESVYAAEPFLFWIQKDNIESLLSKYGFKIITHLDSSEMEKKYLTLKDGTLAEKSMNRFNLVHAVSI